MKVAYHELSANPSQPVYQIEAGMEFSPDDPRLHAFRMAYAQGDERAYDLVPEDVHIDAPLANVLLKYRPTGFIADQIPLL